MAAYVLRVIGGFVVVPLVVLLGIVPRILTLNPSSESLIVGFFAMFIINGAVGGASLKMGKWVILGFGLGFLYFSVLSVAMFFLVSTAVTTFDEYGGALSPLDFVILSAISGIFYALVGALGGAFTPEQKLARVSAVGFGVGGAIGINVFFLLWNSFGLFNFPVAIITFWLLPSLVGSACIGWAASYRK